MILSRSNLKITFIGLFLLLSWQNKLSANDSQVDSYFDDGISIGFEEKGLILADPIYLGSERIDSRELRNDPRLKITGREHFIPLPGDYIERYVEDRPGDTVMVLNSAGKYLAVIDQIGYWIGGCSSGIEYSLRPIEPHIPLPSGQWNFIVLRKGRFYNGRIIPFRQYRVNDSSYLSLENSIKEKLSITYKTYRKAKYEEHSRSPRRRILGKDGKYHEVGPREEPPTYRLESFRINAFCPQSDSGPDSLFITASGATGGEASWFAFYKAYSFDDGWKLKTVMEPWLGPWRYDIYCAIDLDEDGTLEYLILDHGGAIVNMIDGGLERVVSSQHGGC